ncbi:hypothetical protein CISG_00240 [Coccidioides immitis RMSCC 3703]|uniref:N-terminal Ras-GEF domain-containing protein n=1 Tax=Coccidioides immitis RMSCC 3703 TaxID=454286 RepID=A0A0J8QHH5_COCIT|nr:hypothetical protein CISG_00240 [Coccidioides immitis RMSCC 3703]
MEEGGGLSEPGERPMISPRSDGCLPPAPPETGIREPSSPGQNPACMGKFGLWRSHSVAESKSISKIHSSAGEEPARPVWRGDRGGRFLGPRLSKRSQSKGITSDISTASGSREGRHFTVGNVGQNGKIYLRPVPISKQAFHTRGRSQPPGHGHTKHVKSLQPMPQSEDVRHSFWSNSQMSDLRPQHIQESSLGGRTVRDGMAGSYHHGSQLSRRHSLSTIGDEYHPSPSRNRGELRIVIERPDTEEFKPHGKVEVPSLEMSIPHYRLGGFRFTPGAQSSVFYKLKEPIDPSVFDHLMLIMDDVSVVRYAKETKQVTAATPARIVAQISSESFMDYELVSDFFLTFRSYLSPSNLLSLLLARLQWAINRLEDDGRIIRIRVFAALRHWILNYFVDDFVSNRDLRIQFCGRLNHMYEEIKHRNLKKCWNGRCSLYWDAQESADRKDPDEPVVPGGIEGSNDGELSSRDLEEIGHNFENVLGMRVQPPVSARPFSPAAGNLDSRNQQASPEPVVERRTSPLSPSTIQPDSCSFPHIIPKRNSFQSNQAEAPHPVVLGVAEILESELSRPSMAQGTARSAPSDTQKERHLSGDMPANPNYLAASRRDSIPSQLTTGSKSIVIVDDTRTGTPIMPSRLQISLPPTRYDPSKPARSYSPSRDVGSKPFIPSGTIRHSPCYGESFTTMFGSKAPESGRESLVTCGESNRGVNKIFHNIRKYASHESVMNRHKPGSDIESVNRSDISQKSSLKPRGPTLRRRRGGDLRKMQNETESVPRSKASSAADDMTETSSMGGSMLQMANKIHFNERNKEAANRAHPRQRHSLDESRHLRRSFEATVAGFAKIPDDGDGGIESTLLKLEGKWERQSPICGQQGDSNARVDGSCKLRAPGASTLGSSEHGASSTSGVRISSYVESEDSYCSVPLLERGLADDSMKSPRLYDADSNTNSQPQLSGQEQLPSTETEPSLSIEMVEKTDSMQQLPHHSRYMKSRSTSAHPYGNELEIDDYASELSSEISIDVINGAEAAGPSNRNGHGASPIMAFATLGVPTHPLADPPSPPITLGYQGNRTSDVYPTSLQQQPLTPEVSPNSMALRRTSGGVKHIRSHPDNSQRNGETHLQGSPTGALTGPGHTPFILAYDSELLARQFAIVEQAALSEVDWKDLVDMKWSHSSQTTLNWVNYLADQDRKGIDMVVARFNLMVKWALSQIVMTTNRACEQAQSPNSSMWLFIRGGSATTLRCCR